MKTHYRIHRLLAIPLGLFLLVQLLTGALYALPIPGAVPLGDATASLPWSEVRVSPSEAAAGAEAQQIRLYRVGDGAVYEIDTIGGPPQFVDARTGSTFLLDEEGARAVAKETIDTDAPIRHVRRLDAHEFWYPDGHLPCYLVTFDDGNEVYVQAPSGRAVHATNSIESARRLLLSLHEFELVHVLTGSTRVAKLTLLMMAGLGALAILSGYNIVLQQRRALRRGEQLRRERLGADSSS